VSVLQVKLLHLRRLEDSSLGKKTPSRMQFPKHVLASQICLLGIFKSGHPLFSSPEINHIQIHFVGYNLSIYII